ncbi:MAG: transporter substrate-binding domain-containing protein [Marinobacter sp.]|uniref:substrate-binding periplasmic protein n=1 Tax=Marinobacter sp. TaxID=50741 RepID=UPI00299E3778|nr:transporter substrate-binding domain-containing protein [Marinobacter sp.]MDX1633916.1 transporter substrate-binding domain-containing protein [Marinobacter sp.]
MREAGVLRLNVGPNGYPPYMIIGRDGQYSGIVWDVVTRIARRLDYRVVPHKIPRKRVDQMILEGYIDATPRAKEWTQKPERFLFTQPITRIREVFFTTRDHPIFYRVPSDIEGETVVTHLGYRYPELEPVFQSGRAKRFDVTKDRDMFRLLLDADHFEVAVADEAVGLWIIRNNDWQDRIKVSDGAISNFGYRLMLAPGWQSFVENFDRELAIMKDSGELSDILHQYR